MVERTRCDRFEPNDWVEYVDARTGELLAIDEFFNPQRAHLGRRQPGPPGGYSDQHRDAA